MRITHNAYPYAIGPRLGVAYQINPKTVFRAGGAISYAAHLRPGGSEQQRRRLLQHHQSRLMARPRAY